MDEEIKKKIENRQRRLKKVFFREISAKCTLNPEHKINGLSFDDILGLDSSMDNEFIKNLMLVGNRKAGAMDEDEKLYLSRRRTWEEAKNFAVMWEGVFRRDNQNKISIIRNCRNNLTVLKVRELVDHSLVFQIFIETAAANVLKEDIFLYFQRKVILVSYVKRLPKEFSDLRKIFNDFENGKISGVVVNETV